MGAHVSFFLSGLKDDEYAIYAQDSLDSIRDAGAEDEERERLSKLVAGKAVVDKGSYNMGKQKSLSAFFARHVDELERKNCLLILTSQYRAKIGSPIPGQKTVTGGYSLKYYCNTILDLTLIRKIEVGGKWIGSVVRARTKNKARTERPGREVYYVVYFTRGIDNVGSNIDYLYNLRDKDGNLVNDEVSWGGAQGGVIEGLRKKGVFEYSERVREVCWTRLGVDYIAAVARANKHMVIEELWDHKIRRTRREARKAAKNATC